MLWGHFNENIDNLTYNPALCESLAWLGGYSMYPYTQMCHPSQPWRPFISTKLFNFCHLKSSYLDNSLVFTRGKVGRGEVDRGEGGKYVVTEENFILGGEHTI